MYLIANTSYKSSMGYIEETDCLSLDFEKLSKMLNNLPQNITVLKVPHHGASDGLNKEILEYLNPKYSLISVGENYFGHPNIYILALLKNSKNLRTDIDNSIKIVVNKKKPKIFTYNIKKRKYVKYDN